MQLPKHILRALQNDHISVGTECFPPDEEEKFSVRLLSDYFENISKDVSGDVSSLKCLLAKKLQECKKIENEGGNRESLEKICASLVSKLFQIPDNTVIIDLHIVDSVNTNDSRILPEKTVDYTFDSIGDMEYLTGEIYKRRMLNALIAGCASYYSSRLQDSVGEIYQINPSLPSLYYEVMHLNNVLIYLEQDIMPKQGGGSDGGKVDVFLKPNELPTISAEGVIMPVLLEETIKGLLELAISHGLPKNRAEANYIIGKTDFKLAEQWDVRIGCPLWSRIESLFKKIGISPVEVGLSFIFMVLSEGTYDSFNKSMREVFACTKKGAEYLKGECGMIIYNKGYDEFNSHINQQNTQYGTITDDECFSPEELIVDSVG